MTKLVFTVPAEQDGNNAKSFLRGSCGVSCRLLTALKKIPLGITADGRHIRVIDPVYAGQKIILTIPSDVKTKTPVFGTGLSVLYRDEHFMVVDKPCGMPVHPSHNHQGDTLANAVAAYLLESGLSPSFRCINRLDRDTTGLVILALHSHAAHRLSGQKKKEYLAVVQGTLSGSGTINLPIRRVREGCILREVHEDGDRAVTHWTAQKSGNGRTLLSIFLDTGRTHQIRVHFSHIGYPLVGDTLYGDESPLISRQALHCASLALLHPITGEPMDFSAPLPADMQNLLSGMENT